MESSDGNSVSVDTTYSSAKIVRPFNTLRNIYSPKTILVVASENSLKIPDDLKTFTEGENGVHVRFTTKLPLRHPDKHPPIDVIVLVYEVFNQHSLKTIKESLAYIDVRYLVGKCFILVTSDTEFSPMDITEIQTFADSHHLPIHCVPKIKSPDNKEEARLQLPSSLMSIYCPPTGSDVNSLIINAVLTKGNSLLKDDPIVQ